MKLKKKKEKKTLAKKKRANYLGEMQLIIQSPLYC